MKTAPASSRARYKILRLITWLPQGGIERKIVAVLPRLNRELFEPHLCCIRERGPLADQLEQQGVPVHVVHFGSRWDPLALWRLRGLARNLQVDLVHSHMYRSNCPATALKWFDPRLVVIGQYHNMDTWESKAQLWVDRKLAVRRDLNVTVSEAVARNVQQNLGLPDYLVRTVYNCVDLDEFHPVSAVERHAIRESIGIPVYARVVIMVARLVPQKNQRVVLESAPEILESAPKTHFLFVGGGPDEAFLKDLTRDLGIGQSVTFLGRRDDVPRLLASSDVAVLPSDREGFSNAILESMACGIPVVATDVGGNREIIDSGIDGYVVQSGDAPGELNQGQFVRYVKRLVSDDELRTRMSMAALGHIKQFGLDAMVHEVEQLYLELLEERAT